VRWDLHTSGHFSSLEPLKGLMSGLSNPSIFGLQPTLLSFRIFSVKIIEKVENVGDMLRRGCRTERRSGAKVVL